MAKHVGFPALKGYENVAFDYRYLNTDKTPLQILHEYYSEDRIFQRPGQWIMNTYGKEEVPNPELFYKGRDFDLTYRILADEYYRDNSP